MSYIGGVAATPICVGGRGWRDVRGFLDHGFFRFSRIARISLDLDVGLSVTCRTSEESPQHYMRRGTRMAWMFDDARGFLIHGF